MRNLLTYEAWKLEEANKTVEFFKEHPELLSKFATGTEKLPAKSEIWDPRSNRAINTDKDQYLRERIKKQAAEKFKKAGFDIVMTWPDQQRPRGTSFAEWVTDSERNYSNYYSKEFIDLAAESRDAKDFKSNLERKWISKPESSKSDWESFSFWPALEKNWDEFKNICKWLKVATDSANNASQKHFNNELMKLGLSLSDVKLAMTIVSEWTSMSRKKLDSSNWSLLNKISVAPNLLPKYVYRGIFYDGAKIKDQKKFIETWKPGSKPGASQGKATSWSIDRGTAASFMTDQDFIKDRKGGYYVLLKWEVDPIKVIADLRNLPVDHTFWNQQEIIVSPEAKDYEVDTIIPGAEDETYREFNSSLKGGQGAMGSRKKDFVTRDFLKRPYDTINILDRIKWKELCEMTIAEANEEYDADLYINAIKEDAKFGELALPIGIWLDRYGIAAAYKFNPISRNELEIQIGFSLDSISWFGGNPELKTWIDEKKKEINFNPFSSTMIVSGEMSIKLINSSYYNMDFEIILPKKLDLVGDPNKIEKSRNPSSDNLLADEVFEELWRQFGPETFMNILTTKAQQINAPRNIQYTIK